MARFDGIFTATGINEHGPLVLNAPFNLDLDFDTDTGIGTVQLERQFSGGDFHAYGDPFTANAAKIVGETISGVSYRLNCTAFTSGAIRWQFGNG